MSRRPAIALLLVLVALAAGMGAWLLWSSDPPVILSDDVGGASAIDVADEESRLVGARGTRPADAAKPGRGCLIEVEVTRRGQPQAGRLLLYERSRRPPWVPTSFALEPLESLLPVEGIHDAEPAARTVADERGRGAFTAVPLGSYDVAVVTPEGRGTSAQVILQVDGQRSLVRLDVGGGGEVLRGRAVHADGRPFQGFVNAVGEHDTGVPLGPTPTKVGADGRFELTGLDAGVLRVVAWTPGTFAVRSLPLVLPRAGELVIVVDRGMSERGGRVLSERDRRPVAGAVVVASSDEVAGIADVEARGVTDAEGRFRLLFPEVPVSLHVRAAGYVPYVGPRWLSLDGSTEVHLQRPGFVRGRVLAAADGAPVPNVPVFVVPHVGGIDVAGISGPDGRYEVAGASPTESTVFACGAGWVSKDFLTAAPYGYDPLRAVPASETTIVVDLHVIPAQLVSGQVVDSGGAGVEGAVVSAFPKLPGNRPPPLWGQGPDESPVATDAQGRFTLASLPPGVSVSLRARSSTGATGDAGPLRLEGAALEPIVIRLGAPRFAEITVIDEKGRPVAGVGLDLYRTDEGDGSSWLLDGHTGADGVVRLGPLPPGEIQISAWSDAVKGSDVLAGGPEGSTEPIRATVTITPVRRLAGRVRWSDGTPAADVLVALEAKDESASTMTGSAGQFLFESVEASEVELQVGKGEDDEPELTLSTASDREDLEITLKRPRPPRLVLTVLEPDGRPVPEATVQLKRDSHRVENGRLELPVPAADLVGYVHQARTDSGRPLPLSSVAFGPIAPGATSFEVRLPPDLPIEGIVLDPAGRPVHGVRIEASPIGVEVFRRDTPVAMATTDESGRFRLPSIGAGQYRLSADAPSAFAPMGRLEVAGGAKDVRIQLREGLVRSPVVTDPNGRPVVRALVSARAKNDDRIYAESDRDGRARLVGLEPDGVYVVSVTPPQDRNDLLGLRQERWRPSDDPLALPRAFAVDGYVRDGEGQFVAGAEVTAKDSAGSSHSTSCDRRGRFSFLRLPEGEVSLLAEDEEGDRVGRRVTCAAGTRGIVLVLEASSSIRLRLVPAPPDTTEIRLLDEETRESTSAHVLGADGRGEIEGVHPKASYTLFKVLRSPDGRPPWLVALREGLRAGEGEVVVELEPAQSIDGRVTGATSVGGGTVTATRGPVRQSTSLDADGRFVFPNLAAGTWALEAANRDSSWKGSVEAEAGSTVEIRLAPSR